MIKYRFAKLDNGEIVDASQLKGEEIPSNLSCLGCGESLVEKVNGEKIAPHFAHKSSQCNGETYLHNLAKNYFHRRYLECLTSGEPFFLTIHHVKRCSKYEKIGWVHCPNLGYLVKNYDLTRYYREIALETRDGKFVPDLLLKSSKNPDKPIYVEIAVTHFLSEKKDTSENRIIEIPIESEDDLKVIDHARIGSPNARLVNFNEETSIMSDSDCRCTQTHAYGFSINRKGDVSFEFGTLARLIEIFQKEETSIAFSSIISAYDPAYTSNGKNKGSQIFVDQLHQADSSGISVKHCLMCKFHGQRSKNDLELSLVFCKFFKKPVRSDEAKECNMFRKVKSEE